MDSLHVTISELLSRIGGISPEDVEGAIEIPPQAEKGDRAVPCFRFAKQKKTSPQALAEKWKTEIVAKGLPKPFDRVEAAGGYLNFFIESHALARDVLESIFQSPDHYGFVRAEASAPLAVIEFSSPNIAKPFSIGHLRSTNIGMSLSRIFEARGWKVIRINHLGDWGTQFGKLISAYRRWGNPELLKENPIEKLYKLYVRWHEQEISDPTLIEEAREWFARLERGDDEAKELWQWFRELTMEELESLYDRLGVRFDHNWGESHYMSMMPGVMKALEDKNLVRESENATIVDLEADKLGICVVRKSDESSLYITRDLAAAILRHETFKFQKMIYVVGTPQRLHFLQLFKILERLGHDWANALEHVAFGHISFGDEGMSTRKGNVVFLSDVLVRAQEMAQKIVEEKNPELAEKEKVAQAVGLAAILFADVSAKRIKDVRFAWEDVLSFEGETGPYLQYALVRTESLIRKLGREVVCDVPEGTLRNKEEHAVLRQLSLFGHILKRAEEEREPFILGQYLIGLTKLFNKFYTSHRVLDPENSADAQARILLTYGVRCVLKTGLKLLGIPTLERM